MKGRNDFGKEAIETIMSVMDVEASIGTASRPSILFAGYEDVKQVGSHEESVIGSDLEITAIVNWQKSY